MLKTVFRVLLALLVTAAGVMHFVRPEFFVAVVPAYLPYPRALVYISGFFEIAGGIGLLIPAVSRLAAWGLVALFIAVFPANINMALNQTPINGVVYPAALWLRLPLQFVFIAWAYWLTKPNLNAQNNN